MIFLMEYDRTHGELLSIKAFQDADHDAAANERLRRELILHQEGLQREVVLLQAASEGALRETHRRYFADIATLAATDLVGVTN
jgi:hypothetical protein